MDFVFLNFLAQADQEIQFKWFSRPEDEDSTSKTLNPVCAKVIRSLTLICFINLIPFIVYGISLKIVVLQNYSFQTEDNDCSVPVAQPLFEKKDSSVPVSKTKRI